MVKPRVWIRSQKRRIDAWLTTKTSPRVKALTYHYLRQSFENILAVVPISLLLIVAMGVFFQVAPQDPGTMILGLLFAIIGLLLFVDGLRVLVMPLGELIGEELPKKFSLPVVLAVAGILGVLVTFAEPAVASLQPLAELVDRERAPYLFYILNQKQGIMVLCIGMGVGLAAIVGTLRFVNNWSLKPLIAMTVIPTIGLSCFMAWGMPQLAPVLGLAWDCGAVTTGPVTVPILLALGIGVMKCQRQKRLSQMALHGEVEQGSGNALEGFGIVTMASIFPIFMVLMLGLIIGLMFSEEEMLAEVMNYKPVRSGLESPLKEVVGAFRSILPLVVVLLLITFLLLRQGLPQLSVWVPCDEEFEGKDTILAEAIEENAQRQHDGHAFGDDDDDDDDEAIKRKREQAEKGVPVLEPGAAMNYSFIGAGAPNFKSFKIPYDEGDDADLLGGKDEEHATSDGIQPRRSAKDRTKTIVVAIIGYLLAQVGMIFFSLGLNYGFTALGNQAGTLFPSAFLEIEGVEKSPYYPYAVGVMIVLALVWCLGFLATRAEPALNVLGRTVQHLSGGEFSCSMLIYAVSFGVGFGMLIGACKVLFGLPLIYIILTKYAIALTETIFASEDYTNIAWDSAGVTTGPVTVPFVLALGIGFSTATQAPEGFGILTSASVAPIISVLALSLVRRYGPKLTMTFKSQYSTTSQNLAGAVGEVGQHGKRGYSAQEDEEDFETVELAKR